MVIEVYSDGSSSGRTGTATGWGYIVCRNREIVWAGSGGSPVGTNNTAELMGAIDGLRAAEKFIQPGDLVWLIADSQYVLGLATGAYSPTKNQDLAQELRELAFRLGVRTRWVRGHQLRKRDDWTKADPDVLFNNKVDQLAKYGRDRHRT